MDDALLQILAADYEREGGRGSTGMQEGVGKLDGLRSLLLKENLHKHKQTGDDGGSL